jgi:hypothetical protein
LFADEPTNLTEKTQLDSRLPLNQDIDKGFKENEKIKISEPEIHSFIMDAEKLNHSGDLNKMARALTRNLEDRYGGLWKVIIKKSLKVTESGHSIFKCKLISERNFGTPHCLGHLVIVRSLPTIHTSHHSLEQMH